MLPRTLLVILVTLTSFASAFNQTLLNVQVNEAFDAALNDAMTTHGARIDPYYVPDQVLSFERKYAVVNFRGTAKLHNIELDGLGNIQRKGNAHLYKNRTHSQITTTLGLPVLFFIADAEVSFMGIGPKRHFYGQIDESTIETTVSYDPRIETISLLSFKLSDLKGLRLKVDGPGLVTDAVSNLILSNTVALFKRVFRYLIQQTLSRALRASVSESEILKHIMTSF